jgi:hypothetical protein
MFYHSLCPRLKTVQIEKRKRWRSSPKSFIESDLSWLTACALDTSHAVTDEVVKEIHQLLAGKSKEELDKMEKKVSKKLTSGKPVDVEYWELLLKVLSIIRVGSKRSTT